MAAVLGLPQLSVKGKLKNTLGAYPYLSVPHSVTVYLSV